MCYCGVDDKSPSSLTIYSWISYEVCMYDMVFLVYDWKVVLRTIMKYYSERFAHLLVFLKLKDYSHLWTPMSYFDNMLT